MSNASENAASSSSHQPDARAAAPPLGEQPSQEAAAPETHSPKGSVAEILDALNISWEVPRTFAALLHAPGAVAEAYRQRREAPRDPLVAEEARRYVAPFKYILLAAAVATFLTAFVMDMEEEMRRAGEEGVAIASGGEASMADLPPAFQRFMAEAQAVGAKLLTNYAALTHLFIYTPLMALVTCTLFREKGTRFAGTYRHHLGLSAYMWAEFTLLALALAPLALVIKSTLWHNNLELAFMFAYVVWTQMQFFDLAGAKGFLKAAGAFLCAFLAITVVINVVMFGIAFVRVSF